MRNYGIITPGFWTGSTGKQIKALGLECRVIATYLLTCPGANMIGLYYLALPTLAHETGIPIEGASKGLRRLSEIGFCGYDAENEVVWVPEMARYQIGETLSGGDKRRPGIKNDLARNSKSIFFREFIAKYNEPFGLGFSIEEARPLQAPCKPLIRDMHVSPPDPDPCPDPIPSHPTASAVTTGKNGEAVKSKPDPKPKVQPAEPPADFRQFTDYFCQCWERTHQARYPWDKKDGPIAAAIWEGVGRDLSKAQAAIDRYLANSDSFFAGHPLGKLRSSIPQFLTDRPTATAQPPREVRKCGYTPPAKVDT